VTGTTDLETVGGQGYLVDVATFVPSPDNAVYYAKIVRDLEAMRMLDKLGEEPGPMMRDIIKANPKASVHEHRLKYNQAITHEAARILGRGERTLVSMKESLKRHGDRIDELIESGESDVTSCGLPSLDEALCGFKPGEQWVLGAYSGQGKTALAFEMATRSARVTGKPVLFISGEMSESALMERFVTSQTGISVQDQYNPRVVGIEENYQRILAAQEEFTNLPIYICYRPKGIAGITEAIIEAKREVADELTGNTDKIEVNYIKQIADLYNL